MLRPSVALAFLLAQGCKSTSPAAGDAGTLVRPGEAEALERTLLAELDANARRSCPRDLLRGSPAPGSADDAIRAIVEPAGALATCFDVIRRYEKIVDAETGRYEPPGVPVRAYGLPLDAPESTSSRDALAGLRGACATLPAAIARAVQHGDACSPYLPGRRGLPASLMSILRAGKAATILARDALKRDAAEGVQRLMDLLRLSQDLDRGGAPWIIIGITRAMMSFPIFTLERALNELHLSEKTLAALARELDLLARTEPALSEHLRGERQGTELDLILKQLKPLDWMPPGGRNFDDDAPDAGSRHDTLGSVAFTGSGRDDLVLAWVALRRVRAKLEDACANAATRLLCVEAVVTAANSFVIATRGQRATEGAIRDPREAVIGILAATAAPGQKKYLLRAAQRPFYIAALRLHVAAKRAPKWPSIEALRALPEAVDHGYSGKPFVLTPRDGFIEVRSAADLRWKPKSPDVLYVIRIPASGAAKR